MPSTIPKCGEGWPWIALASLIGFKKIIFRNIIQGFSGHPSKPRADLISETCTGKVRVLTVFSLNCIRLCPPAWGLLDPLLLRGNFIAEVGTPYPRGIEGSESFSFLVPRTSKLNGASPKFGLYSRPVIQGSEELLIVFPHGPFIMILELLPPPK